MDDPALPVRVQAAISLGETLDDGPGTNTSCRSVKRGLTFVYPPVRQALLPGLEKIMQGEGDNRFV